MQSALADLKLDLARAAQIGPWIDRFPWAAVGVAAVAGFAAAAAVVPPSSEKARAAEDSENDRCTCPVHGEASAAAKPGVAAKLLDSLFDVAKVGLVRALSQGLQSGFGPQPPHPNGEQSVDSATAEAVAV
jgi:hypothetical protein